ncbi:signal peptide peptidase SppA [Flavobacterium salilacus subsp. salilacus]|uniref:signal peptide peptidase SppA n=1 Tax=Flavobacterium TaxID=237 RepID=UPI0010755036|nr:MULTISPECIES: signal peptide peptidase SppA [Flavobacterium]KAF2518193.1 signal peptide peptidase SppA [Flavobacterium salilacus subsp. salilacus]MBE1615494.1 signal peptide peptidase SppA [Flavobacterium sp. SaA2.13]
MQFLKNVLSTVVGLFLFCLLFLLVIIVIGVAAGSGSDDVVKVKENSVIELDISEVTNDYAGTFYSDEFSFLNSEPTDGLSDVLKAIDAAQEDNKIKGITLTNSTTALGMAQNKALRDKLEDFKKSGKFVVAYSDTYSQADYYLNSVADTIYLNPVGEMEFKGLSSEVMFFKDLQEKTGIKMEVIRHGKFKAAVEPFLSNEMSPENREQISTLLNSVWNTIASEIAESRNIPLDSINSIAENLSARTPDMAKASKLIDKIGYIDEFHNGIRHALKIKKDDEINTVDILDYVEANKFKDLLSDAKDKIAVVYAQGEIGSGKGNLTTIGEISMRKALKAAADDENVKAIVLRVDSPGGSALTSDLIWRDIELAKKKKPVVVSMGNLAASGGYYISCNANRIFTEPTTITGSIGVFGVLPNFTELSKNIGVHTEQVNTHKNAAGYSVFTPLDDDTRTIIQQSVESVYDTFITRVANGRKMTKEQVDAIGQGRVWSGTDAVNIGLADELGGLDDAIAYAAKLGKTDSYSTVNYPEYERNLEDFFADASGLPFAQSKEEFIKEEVGEENYQVIERLRRASQLRGTQVIMPYEITIR